MCILLKRDIILILDQLMERTCLRHAPTSAHLRSFWVACLCCSDQASGRKVLHLSVASAARSKRPKMRGGRGRNQGLPQHFKSTRSDARNCNTGWLLWHGWHQKEAAIKPRETKLTLTKSQRPARLLRSKAAVFNMSYT